MNQTIREKEMLLNEEGFIPGPSEAEEDFFLRVKSCLDLKNSLNQFTELADLKIKTPLTTTEIFSVKALQKTKKLFDISPSWIPIVFSSRGLSYWQGATTWIFEKEDLENELETTLAFFQLKPLFEKKECYLFFYERDEIVAHEMVHVSRMMFEEPKFEEIIAYRTSDSLFRRYFGPLITSEKETLFIFFSLFLMILTDIAFLFFGEELLLNLSTVFKTTFCFIAVLGLLRLFKRQRTYKKALVNLKKVATNEETVEQILFRLTDKEIDLFAKSDPEEILDYKKKQEGSLRWRVMEKYFK